MFEVDWGAVAAQNIQDMVWADTSFEVQGGGVDDTGSE